MSLTIWPVYRTEDDDTRVLVGATFEQWAADRVVTLAVPVGEESRLSVGPAVILYGPAEQPLFVEAIRQPSQANPVRVGRLEDVEALIERAEAPVSSTGVGLDGKRESTGT